MPLFIGAFEAQADHGEGRDRAFPQMINADGRPVGGLIGFVLPGALQCVKLLSIIKRKGAAGGPLTSPICGVN